MRDHDELALEMVVVTGLIKYLTRFQLRNVVSISCLVVFFNRFQFYVKSSLYKVIDQSLINQSFRYSLRKRRVIRILDSEEAWVNEDVHQEHLRAKHSKDDILSVKGRR